MLTFIYVYVVVVINVQLFLRCEECENGLRRRS